MDVDNEQTAFKDAKENTEERNETQNMEEEPESIDIGDLDILGLEQACKTKNYDKIPERQLEKPGSNFVKSTEVENPWHTAWKSMGWKDPQQR